MAAARFGTIGAVLRELRRSRGISQADLAALVGTDQGVISAYERDRRLPSAEMLSRLVVGCGYLLEATDGRGRPVRFPLPRAGWFPDEDLPPPDPTDPPPGPPALGPSADAATRVAAVTGVLDVAAAALEARAGSA